MIYFNVLLNYKKQAARIILEILQEESKSWSNYKLENS